MAGSLLPVPPFAFNLHVCALKTFVEQTLVTGTCPERHVADFVFRSTLPVCHRRALEELVFFNPRQRATEAAIAQAVELYGVPVIVDDKEQLRVSVSKRDDVQCLFALAQTAGGAEVAGMVIYLRTSCEEIVVLHIGVAESFSRGQRSSLEVVMALVRTVRAAARRLRGVERLTMLYLQGGQFQISIARPDREGSSFGAARRATARSLGQAAELADHTTA